MLELHIIATSAAQNFADLPPVTLESFIKMILFAIKVTLGFMSIGFFMAIYGYFLGRRKFSWRPTESHLTKAEIEPYEELDETVQTRKLTWKIRIISNYVYNVDNQSYNLTDFSHGSKYKKKPTPDELRNELAKAEQQNGGSKTVYYDPKAGAKAEFRTSPMSNLELKNNFRSTMSETCAMGLAVMVFMGMVIVLRVCRCDYDPSLSSPY